MSTIDKYYHKIKYLILEYDTILLQDIQYMNDYLKYYGNDLNTNNNNLLDKYNTKLLKFLVDLCLPKDLRDASEIELLPHPGHPCKLGKSGYEVFPNIKSAKTAMRSFPMELVQAAPGYLNLPEKNLVLISPILPSLAKNCSEYTGMINCVQPVKSNISSEKKKKFREAIIKTSKSLL